VEVHHKTEIITKGVGGTGPHKTSLAMLNSSSKWVTRGGGSWTYDDDRGKTKWTQINTIEFKKGLLTQTFLPLLNYAFRRATKKAMLKAKKQLEKV
jgi:hypothetical protein